jgi:hypothetical protein
MFRITSLGLVGLAATLVSSPAAAQAGPEGCTYVRCFLSLQRHPPRLVQGAGATPVADFGLFAPRIDLLSSSSDGARLHYQAFRANYNRAGAFKLISILTDASALIVLAGNPRSNYPYSLGLFAVGVPTGIGALVFSAKAQRQIEQSIADYNRSLPDAR